MSGGPQAIVIAIGAQALTAYEGGTAILWTPVTTGRDWRHFTARQASSAYGPFASHNCVRTPYATICILYGGASNGTPATVTAE